MNSGFLNLNAKDFLKGLVVAVLSALIAGVLQLLQAGPFTFDWATFQPIVLTAVYAALAYLSKNLFTNSAGDAGPEK